MGQFCIIQMVNAADLPEIASIDVDDILLNVADLPEIASIDVDAILLNEAQPVNIALFADVRTAPVVPLVVRITLFADVCTAPVVPLVVLDHTPPRAVLPPADRERLLGVMQHNCEHVLGLTWERFLATFAAAPSRKRKRELYHSVSGR